MIGRAWASIWFRLVLVALVVFLVLLDLWGLTLAPGTVDYTRFGSVGDWFSGIATVGAVIVAALAIRNDRYVAEEERRRLDAIREEDSQRSRLRDSERVRAIAQSLFIWPVGILDDITHRRVSWKLGVANATGAPVYEWRIEYSGGRLIADSARCGPMLPGAGSLDLDGRYSEELEYPAVSDLVLTFTGSGGETYRRQSQVVEVANG